MVRFQSPELSTRAKLSPKRARKFPGGFSQQKKKYYVKYRSFSDSQGYRISPLFPTVADKRLGTRLRSKCGILFGWCGISRTGNNNKNNSLGFWWQRPWQKRIFVSLSFAEVKKMRTHTINAVKNMYRT